MLCRDQSGWIYLHPEKILERKKVTYYIHMDAEHRLDWSKIRNSLWTRSILQNNCLTYPNSYDLSFLKRHFINNLTQILSKDSLIYQDQGRTAEE